MADLILYGMPHSNFVRACAMTAYEKGAAVRHELTGFRDLRAPEMLAVAQFGKVPAMRHGDVVLFESLAIMRYIDLTFGAVDALQPADPLDRIRMDQWFNAVMATVDRHVVREWTLELLFPSGEGGVPDARRIARARKATARDLAILDRQIAAGDYLVAGQFTLADIVMVCTLDVLDRVPDGPKLLDPVPGLARALTGLRDRESWQKAMEGVTFPEPPMPA